MLRLIMQGVLFVVKFFCFLFLSFYINNIVVDSIMLLVILALYISNYLDRNYTCDMV